MSGEGAAALDDFLVQDQMYGAAPSAERRVLLRCLEPIADLLADPELTEIVVNRPGEVFTEGPIGWTRLERRGVTFAHL